MIYGNSLGSLSLVSSHSGGFPIQSSTWPVNRWRSRPGQPAQATHPNIGVCSLLMSPRSVMAAYIVGAVNTLHEGQGM